MREMSEAERERLRAADRERYRRKRQALLADPVAMERFREKARERVRRYAERNAERRLSLRRDREKTRYASDASYRLAKIQRQREYVEKNRQLVYRRNSDYYAGMRDQVNAQRKKWRQANLDRVRANERAHNRARYDADPEAVLRYNREWRRQNPERARLYVRISGHKRRTAAGSAHWTRAEWLALLETHGARCHYCGVDGPMEADHRLPLSRGGANTIDNIVPCCKRCNSSKNDRTEEEFQEYLVERGRRARPSPD